MEKMEKTSQESEDGQSVVAKLKKNVSEIISHTPLSKWFRKQNDDASISSVRRREDDSEDDDDLQELQPPMKRTKLPPTKEALSLNVSEVLSPISSLNNVKKPALYRNFPEPIAGPSGYQTRKMLNSTSCTADSGVRSRKTAEDRITCSETFRNLKTTAEPSELANKEGNSDSEESTSGYSSGRVGSKEMVSQESSKQASPLENSPKKNRSLFHGSSSTRLFVSDRSLSPNRNSSLSSRMPSFNPSTFGSTSFVDRTLSTKKILNSPFYNGRTIYGGASAYGRGSKRVPQDLQKVLRQSVKIKPVNKGIEKGDMQLGKTARRILDTLEQYSSPVSDAKKIPWKRSKTEGSLTKYIGANPYILRESRSASNRELQVPSVTDLLKIKMEQHKARLQNSTEAARRIATKSSSVLNNESYHIPVQRESGKQTTKIKTKITAVRHKVQIEETVPELRLNPVSLPITELPKFDDIPVPPRAQKAIVPPPAQTPFLPPVQMPLKPLAQTPVQKLDALKPLAPAVQKSMPTTTTTALVENKPISVAPKSVMVDKLSNSHLDDSDMSEFEFSAPLVLAKCLKPLTALNNFKFSEPLVKKRRSIHAELDDQENKIIEPSRTKKNNGENISKSAKSGASSGWGDFKPKEGTWECAVCLIRNQADKTKCAACESPKPKSKENICKSASAVGSGWDVFRPKEGTWECSVCLIRNQADKAKCAACESPKAKSNENIPKSATSAVGSGWDAFKPKEGTWECSACLIRNQADKTKCAACETPKPKSKCLAEPPVQAFGRPFTVKAAQNTWECPTCMIRNKEELQKCAACSEKKPDKPGPNGFFNVCGFPYQPKWTRPFEPNNVPRNNEMWGNVTTGETISTRPASSDTKATLSKFNAASNTWECLTCLIRNKDEVIKCVACESIRPNNQPSQPQGRNLFDSKLNKKDEWECPVCMVRNKASAEKCACCESSNPLSNPPVSSAAPKTSTFNFGIDKNTATSFTFGIPPDSHQSSQTNAALVFGESRKEPSATASSEITFGMPVKNSKESQNDRPMPKEALNIEKDTKAAENTSKLNTVTSTPTFSFAGKSTGSEGTPSKTTSIDATPSKSAPTFSFGSATKNDGAGPTTTNTPTFSLGGSATRGDGAGQTTNTPTFSLGSASKGDGAGQSTNTPAFSLGSATKGDGAGQDTNTPTFGFGTPRKDAVPEQKTFGFGSATNKESVGSSVGLATPTFTFGSGNKTDNKVPESVATKINPLLKPNEKLPEKAAVAPVGFNFGLTKPSSLASDSSTAKSVAEKTPSPDETSPSKRSRPDTDSMPPAKIPSFSFKAPSTNGDVGKGLSLFSKPAAAESKPAAAPTQGGFGFNLGTGKATTTTTTAASKSATVAPTFNSTVSQADSSKPAIPMFSFGSSPDTPKQANGFSFASPAASFGSKTSTNTAEAKPFSTQAPPAFGVTPPKTGMFSFGGTTDNKSAPFSFNSPSSENKMPNQFSSSSSFGSTTPKTQQPSFGFNQSPASSFGFGANQKAQQPTFGMGSNAASPFAASSSTKSDSVFGTVPAQSSGINGTFNFGASATTNQRAAGFSFGATSASSEGGAPQGGFGFGSSAMNASAPSAPGGGFNFSSTTPAFDANSKPSFNFTGGAGITAFSAPPAQEGGRKIKKAIRRTVR